MAREKVAITLEESTLDRLDKLVRKRVFHNRSQAIEEAIARIEKAVWPKNARNSIQR